MKPLQILGHHHHHCYRYLESYRRLVMDRCHAECFLPLTTCLRACDTTVLASFLRGLLLFPPDLFLDIGWPKLGPFPRLFHVIWICMYQLYSSVNNKFGLGPPLAVDRHVCARTKSRDGCVLSGLESSTQPGPGTVT